MATVLAVAGVFIIALAGMWADERRERRMRRRLSDFFGKRVD